MALLDIITKGSVDRSVPLRIIDSTDGTPETAVVFNTAGIDLWYRREGAARVSITEVTLAALTTAHTDGGFLHVSDGEYRLDVPDAAFATGANHVDFGGTVTGMVVIGGRVKLIELNLEDVVRGGMTALANAAAGANGGLPTVDANNAVSTRLSLKKNTALNNYQFGMTDSTTHNPSTGKTVTVTRVIDGGAFGGGTLGAVTEIANGLYRLNIPAADLNGDVITLRMTASGCDDQLVTLVMSP